MAGFLIRKWPKRLFFSQNMNKIKQISALISLAVIAQIAVGLPIANAAIFGSSTGGETSSNDSAVWGPVIPYLTSSFRLSNLNSEEKSEPKLTIIQGGFLAASNSPKKLEVSNNSKSLGTKMKELVISISAYSSTPDQTDDSPFITARGTYVRDGIIAANFLPFGTKIKIPEIFGDKIFVVEDRMNRRYWQKIDIWFPDRQSALEFGVKTAKIQIIES